MPPQHRETKLLLALMVFLGLTSFVVMALFIHLTGVGRNTIPESLLGMALGDPKQLTPFQLTDHRGQPFTLERLQGRWTLIFFGYTHCPDVCPTTLSYLEAVFAALEESAMDNPDPEAGSDPSGAERVRTGEGGGVQSGAPENIQAVFVTVDPMRDSAELLEEYVTYFNPEFVGVTGEEGAIEGLVGQFGAHYSRHPGSGDDDYTMSHTTSLFIVSPSGGIRGVFTPRQFVPDVAAEKLRQMVRHFPNG